MITFNISIFLCIGYNFVASEKIHTYKAICKTQHWKYWILETKNQVPVWYGKKYWNHIKYGKL
jgi:hypothetical protein